MTRQPDSLLSLTDFNGAPLADDLLWKSFRGLMERHGYVFMCNVPDTFDPVAFCKRLGDFVPQYTGVLVGDVTPEPGMEEFYHAGNTKPLYPHSEGYDFEGLPPRYLALWCERPNTGAGGETTLADARAWSETLGEADRAYLCERVFAWETTDAMRHLGLDLHPEHPVLEEHPDGLIVRYSFNNLVRGDDEDIVGPLLADAREYFERHHVAVQYERRDMLVFDNWRMLHARNAFTDTGRHLRRIQIAHRPTP
ncbi:TauD/TfdA family dioxygenase [Streptomyces sp. NPDC042638]|uniref:TauD/TfdA family dioxygenase n=1 Tax=Streptomyces sp. NPDC042638 TaxID=3154333 RepID=UPI0033EF93C4